MQLLNKPYFKVHFSFFFAGVNNKLKQYLEAKTDVMKSNVHIVRSSVTFEIASMMNTFGLFNTSAHALG